MAAVLPPPPDSGSVAVVVMPVGPQGELGPRALPEELLTAAVRYFEQHGAKAGLVAVPGELDEPLAFEAMLERLTEAGLAWWGDTDGESVAGQGECIQATELLRSVAAADHVVVLSAMSAHHYLGLSGPLWAGMYALTPRARHALCREAPDPAELRRALRDIHAFARTSHTIAWLGDDVNVLVGGVDPSAVESAAAKCFGVDLEEVDVVGLAPSLVYRPDSLPGGPSVEAPDRFPGVDASLCTRCGSCADLCPTDALTLIEDPAERQPLSFNYSACVRCSVCITACPDFALSQSIRPMATKRRSGGPFDIVGAEGLRRRSGAVDPMAALVLGPDAIDPPARRPTWLDNYTPPDRFEVARLRARVQEPELPRVVLGDDDAVRLIIAPNWGFHDNRTSLGIAYLAGALDHHGFACHVVDLARELRRYDPALTEELEVIGDPDPNGGFYGPRMPLILQAAFPEAWGDACPTLAQRVAESAQRDADRIAQKGALHGLIVADSNVTYVFALAQAIKARGGIVLMGGPTMSHRPLAELALRSDLADAIVVGEGEAAIVALAKAHAAGRFDELNTLEVPGLVSLKDDGSMHWQPNRRNRALDDLDPPDWRGQFMPEDFAPMLTSRGCVTKCSFCSEQTISPKFAQRSVESVIAEMDTLSKTFGHTVFEFNDDLLNGNRKWLQAFCEALVERGAPYQWQGLCRPHRMTRELLALMRAAGCAQITYGVQHFAESMLKRMGRRESPDPLRQVLDDTLQVGITAFIDIIVGHPGETEEEFEFTKRTVVELLERYPHVAINLNPFNYIYGSAVDLWPEKYGVTVDRFDAPLPQALEHLDKLTRQFVVGMHYEPGPEVVLRRVNELASTVFHTRQPAKIPILDEELPFCNDNCLHCGVADIMKTAHVNEFGQIVRSLNQLAPRSKGRVMFAVSELTIRPDFIAIVKAARRAGMRTIALVTNGRMFSYPAFTKRTVKAGLTHALVSVYGPTARVHQAITRTPESFEQTIAGLRDLLRYPSLTVMTNSVITKKNYRYLPQMVELLAGLGVQNINISFLQIIGNSARYQRALVPRIHEVLPYLKDAVDLGVGLGRNMGIGGLPYCVMKGYEHHFGVDDLTDIANSDADETITERSPYTKAEACKRCAYSAVCLGLQDEYLRQFGEEELDPYHGRRLERRPDSEIVRAMFPDMQYTDAGLPSSILMTRERREDERPVVNEGQ